MRHIFIRLFIITLLSSCSPATDGGWFKAKDEQKQKLVEVENQLAVQRKKTDTWAVIAGCLGIGCVLLFVIGTAIGSRTKHAPRT
jgi:hypothetical protein